MKMFARECVTSLLLFMEQIEDHTLLSLSK